jgi:hypothetical protein
MKHILIFLFIGVATGCSRYYTVTLRQPMQIVKIDTIGKNLLLRLEVAGTPRSIYGMSFHAGDTLVMLRPQKMKR